MLLALSLLFLACRAIYLPGLAAGLAWQDFDNPIFYADRFALPTLFPDDQWAGYQRYLYPLSTLVHAVPALMWKYLAVPPIYPTFLIVALNDFLVVLAVYWLSRALSLGPLLSAGSGLLAVASQFLSWNLAGYAYAGGTTAYAGSFVIPFTLAVVPALIQRRVGAAMGLAAVSVLVYAPYGAVALGTVGAFLLMRREAALWRRAMRWAPLPVAALLWVAAVQFALGRSVTDPMSHAEQLALVLANGHFVPTWAYGRVLATPYLGYLAWCLLAVVSLRALPPLESAQRQAMASVLAIVFASFVAWAVAYQFEWLVVLRAAPLRTSLLLSLASLPLVFRYLVLTAAAGRPAAAMAAGTCLAMMVLGSLPGVLIGVGLLAALELRRSLRLSDRFRHAETAVAVFFVAGVADMVFGAGIVTAAALRLDPSGWIARNLLEPRLPLQSPTLEALALVLLMLVAWRAWAGGRLASRWNRAQVIGMVLCVFSAGCIAARSAGLAVWWATGEPRDLRQVELWARHSTPEAAKFIFFEMDPTSHQLSWHTLSQRGAAELQYTFQKAYSPDRRLLAIDRAVDRLYGIESGQPGSQAVDDLWQRYRQFSRDDFLRVGRLSGSSFAVLRAPKTLAWPVAFRNGAFAAYRVPAQFGQLQVVAEAIGPRAVALAWNGPAEVATAGALMVSLLDATGDSVAEVCCVPLTTPRGHARLDLPARLPRGRYLPVVSMRAAADGAHLPPARHVDGSHRAFWETIVVGD
jgi:hypothetical protein